MIYLAYEEYQTMTISPITEQAFGVLEPEAELMLDDWTMDRLHDLDPIPDAAKRVMAMLVDGLYAMYDGSKRLMNGESVKSYSNGISSFSFDTPFSGTVEEYEASNTRRMYDKALTMLPGWLVSRVVPDPRFQHVC